jgi:hypothetical protein
MSLVAKHVHAKFQLSSFYPDGLRHIFIQNFSGNPQATSKKFQNQVSRFMFQLAEHVHAKFQLSSFYPAGLRQIFKLFIENSRFS